MGWEVHNMSDLQLSKTVPSFHASEKTLELKKNSKIQRRGPFPTASATRKLTSGADTRGQWELALAV